MKTRITAHQFPISSSKLFYYNVVLFGSSLISISVPTLEAEYIDLLGVWFSSISDCWVNHFQLIIYYHRIY